MSMKQTFIDKYNTYRAASVGVVAVRTSEPYFAVDCLRQMGAALPRPVRVWDCLQGWQEMSPDLESTKVAEHDNTFDVLPALSLIEKGSADNEKMYPSNAIYAMIWPHMFINGMPPAIAALGYLSMILPRTKKRLVLIIPDSYELPPELTQLIPIIDLGLPELDELATMYEDVTKDSPDDTADTIEGFTVEERSAILNAGTGMTRKEFQDALSITIVNALAADSVNPEFMRKNMTLVKTEIVKRTNVLEVMPIASMADVGGLDELKAYVSEMKHTFTDAARRRKVDIFKGIALFGPPGTGKSLAGKAVGHELGLPVIKFDVSKVFDKYVGNSESNVRTALKIIEAMAPCVVLVDEIDKLFNVGGGGGDSGVGQRVLGAILTFMQENTKPVAWVITGNRVDNLPSELLRKGRVNEIFSVTTPNEDERRGILQIHLRKRGVDIATVPGIDKAVERSTGFVGAEVEEAVSEAVRKASILAGEHDADMVVTGEMIVAALGNMKPLSEAFKEQFDRMKAWADANARPSSAEGARRRTRQRAEGAVAPTNHRRFDAEGLGGKATPTPDGF